MENRSRYVYIDKGCEDVHVLTYSTHLLALKKNEQTEMAAMRAKNKLEVF